MRPWTRPLGLCVVFAACGGPVLDKDVMDTDESRGDYTETWAFTVTADEPFEHGEVVDPKGEGWYLIDSNPPDGVTVAEGMDEPFIDSIVFTGTLSAGTYEFDLRIEHYLDAPSEFENVDVTITSQ